MMVNASNTVPESRQNGAERLRFNARDRRIAKSGGPVPGRPRLRMWQQIYHDRIL